MFSPFHWIVMEEVTDGGAGGGLSPEQQAAADIAGSNLESQEQPLPEGSKAEAPAGGQAGEGQGTETEKQDPPNGQGSGEEKKPSKEDVESLLSGSENPDARAERLERDYRASSREAKRLNEDMKQRNEILASQGFKWDTDVDGKRHLVPTGKGSKDPIPGSFEDLPRKDQKAFESLLDSEDVDIEDVFKFVASRTSRKPAPAPTAESVVHPISDERKEMAFKAVANNAELFPSLADNRDLIESQLESAPKEVKAAFHAAPEYMIGLLDSQIQAAYAALDRKAQAATTAKEKKKDEAASAADVAGSQDGGQPTIGSGKSSAEQKMAERIANAGD